MEKNRKVSLVGLWKHKDLTSYAQKSPRTWHEVKW